MKIATEGGRVCEIASHARHSIRTPTCKPCKGRCGPRSTGYLCCAFDGVSLGWFDLCAAKPQHGGEVTKKAVIRWKSHLPVGILIRSKCGVFVPPGWLLQLYIMMSSKPLSAPLCLFAAAPLRWSSQVCRSCLCTAARCHGVRLVFVLLSHQQSYLPFPPKPRWAFTSPYQLIVSVIVG